VKILSLFQRRYNRDLLAQRAEAKRLYEQACRDLDDADDDPTIPIPCSTMLEMVRAGER
jgi:hypothetical protein